MPKRALIFLLVTFLSAPALSSPDGAEIEGSVFAGSHTERNTQLILVGVGLLRYWGFKAYTGAFYLERGAAVDEALMDRAKRIELEYMRPIKGEDFGPATDKKISENVDAETLLRLRSRIDYHNSLYEDVKAGDRYSLTYIPGRGTELALNGEPKGTIEGADFAAAIFSIWIGPRPIDASFKNKILGL